MTAKGTNEPTFGFHDLASAFVGGLFAAVASIYTPSNALLIAASALLGSVVLVLLSRAMRKSSKPPRILLSGGLITLFLISLGGGWYATLADGKERYQSLFVTNDGLRLRDRAGLGGELISSLSSGTEVFQIDRSWRRYLFSGPRGTSFDYWRYVRTRDGEEGWAYGSFLDVRPPVRNVPASQ